MSSSGVQAADPLAVEPVEPGSVEDGAARLHAAEVEEWHEVGQAEDLVVGAARPAQQGEVVDDGLAHIALAPVRIDRGLTLALAHLGAVGIEDEGQVREGRRLSAERPEEQHVLGRVGEMVLAADDVADAHGDVVHDDREVVQRGAIRAGDDEVAAQRARIDGHVPAHQVVELHETLADAEADDGRPTFGATGDAVRLVQVRAAAHVGGILPGFLLGRAVGGQLLRRAEAGVGQVPRKELLDRRRVVLAALRLAIWPEGAAGGQAGDLRSFVPLQAEPMQAGQDVALEVERRASGVRVLQAQDEGAPGLPREEVVEEGRSCRADVQRAGGTGRDAAAGGHRGVGSSAGGGSWMGVLAGRSGAAAASVGSGAGSARWT